MIGLNEVLIGLRGLGIGYLQFPCQFYSQNKTSNRQKTPKHSLARFLQLQEVYHVAIRYSIGMGLA